MEERRKRFLSNVMISMNSTDTYCLYVIHILNDICTASSSFMSSSIIVNKVCDYVSMNKFNNK